MKPIIPFALLGALLTVGAVNAASTTPVGYASQTISQGFNLVGLTLQGSATAVGNFETVAGTALTDTGVTYSVTAGRTYVLEITSGTLNGTIQEVLAANISGSTITTPDNLQTSGLLVGDTYKLRLAPTIEEVFGVDGSVVTRGANSGVADVIWVPNGATTTQYFIHPTGNVRIAGGQVLAPNVPLIYSDAVWVQKKGLTSTTLTVTGEVKLTGTNSVAVQGYNLVSIVAPVGLNLFNSGLAEDIAVGANAGVADLVWVPTGAGAYSKYFRHPTGFWRDSAAPLVNMTQAQAEAVVFPSAVLVQRKGLTAAALSLNVPTTYSSL